MKKMQKNKILRSPFFYVGDKYKLVPQLTAVMPAKINRYIEPFVGGGSSLMNVEAKEYFANDIDANVINLHEHIKNYAEHPKILIDELMSIIDGYSLSCSFIGRTVPDSLKKAFPKTYYSRFNKESYLEMRDAFNAKQSDFSRLYLLLIYGFNHMIRFNAAGKFNLPVGNVDFNRNVYNALTEYLNFMAQKDVKFFNCDYRQFIDKFDFREDDYVFLDPPYLISQSEYNKLWSEEEEIALYKTLDGLNERGVHFGITNLYRHKGHNNPIFERWSRHYKVYDIVSNYISFNDNTVKTSSQEVFVTNVA